MSKTGMIKFASCTTLLAALGALPFAGSAHAQNQAPAASPPDLSGNYQCKPNPDPCNWSGDSASISQSGTKLQIKGGNGAMADAVLTSDSTISAQPTFNSIGIIRPDHSIDWSDGTKWTKQ
jgi:hypothetical protein